MISLIICSLTEFPDKALLKNIDDTIGVPYEVICVDNSTNRYSIFAAYNYGASLAKYDLLCFMHADILYHTKDWGKIVAGKLKEAKTGVIGVAGAIFKSSTPSPWWISDFQEYRDYLRYNILQHFRAGTKKRHAGGRHEGEGWNEVLVLDGVWMCCRKELWKEIPFDEQNYTGFHFYDLDFSLTAFVKGYRNFVSQEILLEHFSAGHMDKKWIGAANKFHHKWRKVLPVSTEDISGKAIKELESAATRHFLHTLIYNRHHNFPLWLKYWGRRVVQAPFKKDTVMALLYYGRSYFS